MDMTAGLLFCAALITKLVDLIKTIAEERDKKLLIKMIVFTMLSFGLGIAIAYGAPFNLFAIVGIDFANEAVAKLITGLAIGAGASFLYDLFDDKFR